MSDTKYTDKLHYMPHDPLKITDDLIGREVYFKLTPEEKVKAAKLANNHVKILDLTEGKLYKITDVICFMPVIRDDVGDERWVILKQEFKHQNCFVLKEITSWSLKRLPNSKK